MNFTSPLLNVRVLAPLDGTYADESVPGKPEGDVGLKPGSPAEALDAFDAEPGLVVVHAGTPPLEDRRSKPDLEPLVEAFVEPTVGAPGELRAITDVPVEVHGPVFSETTALVTAAQSQRKMPSGQPEPAERESQTIPVSKTERRMLEKKFSRWGERFYRMEDLEESRTWTHKGRAYSATFKRLPAETDVGLEYVMVEVTREYAGSRFTTQVRMKNLAFSNYAQFVDWWSPLIELHNDQSDGRFHSNSELYLTYSREIQPVFHGKVTTALDGINTSGSTRRIRRDEIFLGGLETGVGRITMPKQYAPFPGEASDENGRIQVFDAEARITFHPNGTYRWENVDSANPGEIVPLSDEATYLIAEGEAALHIKGVVDGRVLVYSPEKIIIEGNLVYAVDPETVPDSDDYLGLVSDRHVEVAGPDLTGTGDLLINASIYAGRGFLVRNHTAGNGGTLSIYGSLAAGSVSATEPRFRTRIRFDRRFSNSRPPRFPLTDRYEMETWDANWKIQQGADRIASGDP